MMSSENVRLKKSPGYLLDRSGAVPEISVKLGSFVNGDADAAIQPDCVPWFSVAAGIYKVCCSGRMYCWHFCWTVAVAGRWQLLVGGNYWMVAFAG